MNPYIEYQMKHGNIVVEREYQSHMERLISKPRHAKRVYVRPFKGSDDFPYAATHLMGFPAWRTNHYYLNHES
jgi:hypothetical protein